MNPKIWFARFLALMFIISMVASPQAMVMATDHAPDESSTDAVEVEDSNNASIPGDGSDNDDADTPSGDLGAGDQEMNESESEEGAEGENLPASPQPNEADSDETDQPEQDVITSGSAEFQPNAELFDNYDFYIPEWNPATNELTTRLIFDAEFTANEGDTITLGYPTEVLQLTTGRTDSETFPIDATADQAAGTMTFTVTTDWSEPAAGATSVWIHFAGEVTFPACEDSRTPYTNQQTLIFTAPDGSEMTPVVVDGVECPATLPPVEFDSVWLEPGTNYIELGLYVWDYSSPGNQQMTITYPQDRLVLSNDPVPVYAEDRDTWDLVPVGTAVANDGVVTVTFLDVDPELNLWQDPWMTIPATLITTCDPGAGMYFEDFEPLTFTGNPGNDTQTVYLEGILCNAAGASKSGEFNDDGTRITWTVDSGDILGDGYLYDYALSDGFVFDCESMNIEPAYDGVEFRDWCGDDYFDVEFRGEGVTRVYVTIESVVDADIVPPAYVNCIYSGQDYVGGLDATAETSGLGYGGEACAEIFPETGGDFITKSASEEEVEQGDTLTYTVNVSTTSEYWSSIELTDVLPAGFEITNVDCTVVPAELSQPDCYSQDGNTITARLYQDPYTFDEFSAAEITLEIEGVVTAEPGTELVSEACSIRTILPEGPDAEMGTMNMGDPTIPGGGEICASVTTLVLGDDDGETPDPDPSPTATGTPIPTDPATPGVTPDPTATSEITGLPETGTSGSGISAFALIATMLAATGLMAAALGTRIRARA